MGFMVGMRGKDIYFSQFITKFSLFPNFQKKYWQRICPFYIKMLIFLGKSVIFGDFLDLKDDIM